MFPERSPALLCATARARFSAAYATIRCSPRSPARARRRDARARTQRADSARTPRGSAHGRAASPRPAPISTTSIFACGQRASHLLRRRPELRAAVLVAEEDEQPAARSPRSPSQQRYAPKPPRFPEKQQIVRVLRGARTEPSAARRRARTPCRSPRARSCARRRRRRRKLRGPEDPLPLSRLAALVVTAGIRDDDRPRGPVATTRLQSRQSTSRAISSSSTRSVIASRPGHRGVFRAQR